MGGQMPYPIFKFGDKKWNTHLHDDLVELNLVLTESLVECLHLEQRVSERSLFRSQFIHLQL